MVSTIQQSGGGDANQVTLDAVLNEIREMRAEMRDMECKASVQLPEVREEVMVVKDVAECAKKHVARLSVGLAKVKTDLGGEVVGVRAKVNNIATEVDSIGAKFLGHGTKLDKLQADFFAVKVVADEVADGNEDIKSSMRKMKRSMDDLGERIERALKGPDGEWRERKKRRLENCTSDLANDEQEKIVGPAERRQFGPAAQVITNGDNPRNAAAHAAAAVAAASAVSGAAVQVDGRGANGAAEDEAYRTAQRKRRKQLLDVQVGESLSTWVHPPSGMQEETVIFEEQFGISKITPLLIESLAMKEVLAQLPEHPTEATSAEGPPHCTYQNRIALVSHQLCSVS